ncbi:MAG: ABC transporter ATP-binding protein [Candidatus Aenigmarchaeota archaeon]|nr:ABC transporter ATP-binding protein [Candidatus Aenigmarchaeota archaeon]
MKEPAISIRGLTKSYGSLKAVDNLTLEIKQGEFFGFLGPNGAGKTTTISIITGLARYGHGEVKVFGKDVTREYREARRLIGVAPQEFNFDLFFTVEETLKYYAGYFGLAGHEARKRIGEVLEQFGLLGKRNAEVRKLSGGMKRRLLIARALVHKPRLLILDEPTAGVDVELRRELWQHMKELNRSGTTILLTTHYIEEAEKLAKRIGIINHGKIVALDEKSRLIEQLHKINLDITLAKPIASIPPSLKKYHVTLLDDNRLRFVCGEHNSRGKILKAVQNAGLKVKSEEVSKSTLEDIFLDLTGGANGKR